MKDKLTILWTNADPITSELMVFMYAENALLRDWWKEVEIIIWGGTAKLVAENKQIQEKLLDIKSKGVQFRACIACATELGVVEKLTNLGLVVEPMGVPLTDVIKNGEKLITL